MHFTSFSCLMAVARTSSTVLNSSGESGCTSLVLDLKGKAFSLSPINMMLALGFPQIPFMVLRNFPCILRFMRGFFFLNNKRVLDYV